MKDSQRSRVYAWEKKFYSMKRNKDFTTLTSIQLFLDGVMDDIGLDAKIEVVSSRKLNSNWAWAKTYEGKIVLPGLRCMSYPITLCTITWRSHTQLH